MSAVTEVQIIYSAGGQFYAIPEVRRECGLWLSLAKHPLPVPNEWHRPGLSFAAVMSDRAYWRTGHHAPLHTDRSKAVSIDDELVRDYRDASWWAPGLEEAWAESEGFKLAVEEATKEKKRTHAGACATGEKRGKR